MRLLYAVNYSLPERDYRVMYANSSPHRHVTFALPARPANVPEDRYVRLGFGEGLSVADLTNVRDLAMLLLRRRRMLDAAHFYSTKLLLVGPVLARLVGIRPIITVTGFGRLSTESGLAFRAARLLYDLLFRLAVALSDAVLFQNTADQALITGRLPRHSRKFHYVGSALEMPLVPVRQERGHELTVLLVARLLPSKGVADFLAVADALVGQGARFVLVGAASPGHRELLAAVQDAVRRGAVEYHGRLEGEALLQCYASSHILCFPSRGEGLARVMIEAGFSGLAPVAYDIPGNRDLLPHDIAELLPTGDLSRLIEDVRLLLRDSDARQARAEAYQRHVVRCFDMDSYRRRMDAVLESLPG